MNLKDAVALLESTHSRIFAELYKHFNYKDDALLSDYLDFVVHEPREWMRGFPASWKSASMFGKPRAAFHKLLKDERVVTALGAEYVCRIHDTIWHAFKEHTDSLLEERGGKKATNTPTPHSTPALPALPALPVNETVLDDDVASLPLLDDVESVHSVKKPRMAIQMFPIRAVDGPVLPTKVPCNRCATLELALNALLSGDGDENARLRGALAALLTQ
jgi:hypothetical protein